MRIGLKCLFGTADAKGVRRLNIVCGDLLSFGTGVVHDTEQRPPCLHTLDEAMEQCPSTVGLAKALRD
jgi:hypothetical protein